MEKPVSLMDLMKGKYANYGLDCDKAKEIVIDYSAEERKIIFPSLLTGMQEQGRNGEQVIMCQQFFTKKHILCNLCIIDEMFILVPIEAIEQPLCIRGEKGFTYIGRLVNMVSRLYDSQKFDVRGIPISIEIFKKLPDSHKDTMLPYWLLNSWSKPHHIGAFFAEGEKIQEAELYGIAGYDVQHDYARTACNYVRPLMHIKQPEKVYVELSEVQSGSVVELFTI